MKMKKTLLGLSCLAFGAFAFLVCSYDGIKSDAKELETHLQDTTFLVNLSGTSISLGEDGVKQAQEQFEKELNLFVGRNNYTISRAFKAANVVEVKANSRFESVLSTLTNVTHVAEDQMYRFEGMLPNSERTAAEIEEGYVPYVYETVDVSDTSDNANQSAISMNVPSTTNGGKGTFIAILDTGYLLSHNYFADLTDTSSVRVNFTDITEAVDTGDMTAIQSSTASQGDLGSLWYNYKIPFYYDYSGTSLNGGVNGYDVTSTVSEHGTHVASIAGANGTYSGIAPNAQLALMKVFYESIPTDDSSSAYTGAYDSDIIEALNDCIVLGVDALNMSLGSDLDDFDSRSTAMSLIDDLSDDGIICSIAAGNAGKGLYSSIAGYKNWTTDLVDTGTLGSYANSDSADIIASSTTEKLFYETGLKLGDAVVGYSDQVDYSDGTDGITRANEKLLSSLSDIENLELVIIEGSDGSTIGAEADYTNVRSLAGASSDNTYFNNKIAVVDRGDTTFVAKATAAENAGCAGLIVVNNDPTAYEFDFGMSWSSDDGYDIPTIPVVFILYQDRETVWDYCREQSGDDSAVLTGSVELIEDELADNPNAFEMSTFSTDGARYDLTMNPTISTPGSSIRGAGIGDANSQGVVSTLDNSSVAYLSGTSMATPNYTGVVALMMGEQEFTTETERREYGKQLTSILMSTAQVYSDELTTYGEIEEGVGTNNNSTPSDTSDDYEVNIYTPNEDETVVEEATYSPRKQGAGVVDVSKAIDTKVYLEGLEVNDDGTFGEDGIGFAKIELRNNNLLKNNGTLSFEVLAHNSTGSTVTYTASFSLMTPQLTSYHTSENELPNYVSDEAQFEGAQVSSDRDSYRIMNLDNWDNDAELETSINLGTVSIPSGDRKVELGTYTLSEAQKQFITENFENGTYVEGYITLSPNSETDETPTLNIPYMGFYGDYATADAVEPFDFEKEETYDRTSGTTDGKLYGSDLLNYLGENSYSKTSIDTGSMITVTSFESYQGNNTAKGQMLQNNASPLTYGSTPTTTYDEDTGEYTLYVGGDSSDVLYIQQYVYRSMNSGLIEIIDQTGKTVKSKYLNSMYHSSTELYKSLVNTSYISSYIFAERAYAELPLYYDSGAKLNDGTYTLKFTYELVYGSTQTKEFNLVIDTNAPSLVSKSVVTINGSSYVRLKFDEIYINENSSASIIVNAGLVTNFIYSKTSDGFIVDIPYNEDTFYNGKLHITLFDGARSYARYLINQADLETGLFVQSSTLTIGNNYTYTETNNLLSSIYGNIDTTYEIIFTDYSGNEIDVGTYDAYITFTKSVSSYIAVYGIDEDGNETTIRDISLLNDSQTLKITTNYTSFRVVDTSISQTTVTTSEYGSVSIASASNGSVYVDKVSGFVGDRVTIYAIPDDGYQVESVTVNGVSVSADSYGNYPFYLTAGQNQIVVTFVAVAS